MLMTFEEREKFKKNSDGSKIAGIDLGTSNSAIAISEDGTIEDSLNNYSRIVPSVLSVDNEGIIYTGFEAINRSNLDNVDTIYSVKGSMGIRKEPFKLGKLNLTPEEVSAHILMRLVSNAEKAGVKIGAAVVTIPARFTEPQRQATIDAARIANIKLAGIINEPTAAAISYGLNRPEANIGSVLVYDLGGGTFDVAVIKTLKRKNENGGDTIDFETIVNEGDTQLGGDDYDKKISELLREKFEDSNGSIANELEKRFSGAELINEKRKVERRLLDESKKIKIGLTTQNKFVYFISQLIEKKNPVTGKLEFLNASGSISLDEFRIRTAPLTKRTIELTKRAISKAIEKENNDLKIDRVILVGGSTRMRVIEEALRGEKILTEATQVQGKKPNVDEAVAIGAYEYALSLFGEEKGSEISLVEVTPLNLGIETANGIMEVIIPANEIIPAEKDKIFTTAVNNQSSARVNLYQGDSRLCNRNMLIGSLELSNIAPAPAGVPQISVSIKINIDGMILLEAVDKSGSGKRVEAIIKRNSLSEDEINRMRKEAASRREEEDIEVERINAVSNSNFYFGRIIEKINDFKKEGENKGEEFNSLISNLESLAELFKADIDNFDKDNDSSPQSLEEKTNKFNLESSEIVGKLEKIINDSSPKNPSDSNSDNATM